MADIEQVERTVPPPSKNLGTARRRNLRQLFEWAQLYGVYVVLVVLVLFNIIFTPYFFTSQTLFVNLSQVSTIGIVAIGMALVIATGGIDLSVGSLMAIAGALAPIIFLNKLVTLDNGPLTIALSFIVPVVIAGLLGGFNGTLVTYFKLQPIIATLILFIVGRGIAQVITNGNLQNFSNTGFQYIGKGRIFDLPFQALLMFGLAALIAFIMRVTVFGRQVLAVGGNERAARLAGVPVNRTKLIVYTLSGVFSGIAGLIIIAINSSSDANQVGLGIELDAIAAVAVGGTPLTGGRVSIFGTLAGAFIINLIRNTLLAKGVPDALALVIKAGIILAAVYFQKQAKA